MGINGAVILYKEKGITSFLAVRKVKNLIGADKAGHTGTLDPMAKGVLVVCLGKHTRLVDYLMQDKKEYRTEMYLGMRTDTYDLEGIPEFRNPDIKLNFNDIEEIVLGFRGKINQTPPIYSAIKVGGRKLYEYAREGREVEIPERTVEIHDIRDISITDDYYSGHPVTKVCFTVICSKGTYIRSLCNDIGKKTGLYGTMVSLERTSNGGFSIKDSHTISEIGDRVKEGLTDELIIDPIPYSGLDRIELDSEDYNRYLKGIPLQCEKPEGEYLAVSEDGTVVGIGIVGSKGRLKGKKRLI